MVGLGLGALILAIIAVGSAYLSSRAEARGGNEPIAAPVTNSQAPDFHLQTLDGTPVELADFKGKAVLINFWATWCGPCRQEMPLIEKYHQKYPDDLVVLAVNNDEPASDVQAYVNDMKLSFRVLLDPGEKVENIYRIHAFPTSIFVDSQGMIRYLHIGVLNEGQLVQYLQGVGVSK